MWCLCLADWLLLIAFVALFTFVLTAVRVFWLVLLVWYLLVCLVLAAL